MLSLPSSSFLPLSSLSEKSDLLAHDEAKRTTISGDHQEVELGCNESGYGHNMSRSLSFIELLQYEMETL